MTFEPWAVVVAVVVGLLVWLWIRVVESRREADDRREQERAAIRQRLDDEYAGLQPDDPCPASFGGDFFWRCQTGVPAATPHQHRAVTSLGRAVGDWLTGRGNRFEDEQREHADRQWVTGNLDWPTFR